MEEKLGKLVAMARSGSEHEKRIAENMVRNICIKNGLVFDDVMNNGVELEFYIDCKNDEEHKILAQIIARYAMTKRNQTCWCINNPKLKHRLFFKCTRELYVETLNAWYCLGTQYKREKERLLKALYNGFLMKHNLYFQMTQEEIEEEIKKQKDKEYTKEEIAEHFRAKKLAEGLETVNINKLLG